MALTARFTFTPACAGGNHWDASLDFTPGPTVTVAVNKAVITEPVTAEDREQFARILLKAARAQNPTATAAQLKTAVEAKVWDLTVVV